jgi:hypothetical protein
MAMHFDAAETVPIYSFSKHFPDPPLVTVGMDTGKAEHTFSICIYNFSHRPVGDCIIRMEEGKENRSAYLGLIGTTPVIAEIGRCVPWTG